MIVFVKNLALGHYPRTVNGAWILYSLGTESIISYFGGMFNAGKIDPFHQRVIESMIVNDGRYATRQYLCKILREGNPIEIFEALKSAILKREEMNELIKQKSQELEQVVRS